MFGKIICVGSRSLNIRLPNLDRKEQDLDLMCDYNTFLNLVVPTLFPVKTNGYTCYPIDSGKKMVVRDSSMIVEVELTWEDSSALSFSSLVCADLQTSYTYTKGLQLLVPSVEALHALKMSHRYLKNSPSFLKTMADIHYLRDAGAELHIASTYRDWFVVRERETYAYLHPSLKATKSEFFKNESFYQFDHDTIHESVKIGERPAYTDILETGAEVACSLPKFSTLTFTHKLNCVLEECYVLALERCLIPNDFAVNADKAFWMALEKVCTSITSGWFREWAWEHYNSVLAAYSDDYVDKFKTALHCGKIKPFEKTY